MSALELEEEASFCVECGAPASTGDVIDVWVIAGEAVDVVELLCQACLDKRRSADGARDGHGDS